MNYPYIDIDKTLTMKHFFLLILFFIQSASFTRAQSFVISPNDTIVATAASNHLTIYDIYQKNNSGSSLYLAWTKEYESIPAGWDYSLCDYGTCYPGLPANGSMASVAIADSGFLGLNINPYNYSGTATVRIYVYETSAPSSGDTLTWIINASPNSVDDLKERTFSVFPNPAQEILRVNIDLSGRKDVWFSITDTYGKTMLFEQLKTENTPIDISGLASGTYIFKVIQENGPPVINFFVKQ